MFARLAITLLLLAAACARPHEDAASADAGIRLDQETVTRWFDAARGFATLQQEQPELQDSLSIVATEPLQQAVARYERIPNAGDILDEAGTTAREYVLTAHALFGAIAAADTLSREQVSALPPGQANDNVRFIALRRFWIQERLLQLHRGGGMLPVVE